MSEEPHQDPRMQDMVRYEVADGIATITLDREEARNALTWDMRDRLGDLFVEASQDLSVRVVVLTGTGRSFCAGADLRKPQPVAPRPDGAPKYAAGDVTKLLQQGWQRLTSTVLGCDKPVICALNGVAAGGGAQLALACDLVIASDAASLVEVFVDRGIVPDAGAAWLVTRLVGPHKAKELLFLGDKVQGEELAHIGLVNRVVPAQQLDAEVAQLAKRLALAPTKAIAITKQLVNKAYESSLQEGLWDEAVGQELAQSTNDASEGVRAFVERRDAKFKGW
ncbi:MAG: 2-(1,2-epoxy-1,2-dihydrophenyl)acetyl-CoA isomerase [Glaciecola sp.]|jgi:2-(1,2-epoxy-1,2-dihydrophenyl)acetyl-CoA isomerase